MSEWITLRDGSHYGWYGKIRGFSKTNNIGGAFV